MVRVLEAGRTPLPNIFGSNSRVEILIFQIFVVFTSCYIAVSCQCVPEFHCIYSQQRGNWNDIFTQLQPNITTLVFYFLSTSIKINVWHSVKRISFLILIGFLWLYAPISKTCGLLTMLLSLKCETDSSSVKWMSPRWITAARTENSCDTSCCIYKVKLQRVIRLSLDLKGVCSLNTLATWNKTAR